MAGKAFSPTNIGNIGLPKNNIPQRFKSKKEKEKEENIRNAIIQFATWLSGFAISLLPLLIVPLSKLLDSETFKSAFSDFFLNPEILFVGISIAIAALNDFVNNSSKVLSNIWFLLNMIFVVLGALTYTAMVAHSYYRPEAAKPDVFKCFVIVYLGIILILGCSRYIKNILAYRKEA